MEKLIKEVEEHNSPEAVREREREAELESERLAEQQRMDRNGTERLKNEQGNKNDGVRLREMRNRFILITQMLNPS